ncbi:MAG: hypothetical protein OXC01_17465 [Immundisolibacterales bacterium]|nr:hypothetical protein [Immundisolibacterales bacterium]
MSARKPPPDTRTGAVFRDVMKHAIAQRYLPRNPGKHQDPIDEAEFVRRLFLHERVPRVHLIPPVHIVFAVDEYRKHFPKGRLPRELRLRAWLYATMILWFKSTRPVEPLTDPEAIRIVASVTGYSEATIRRDLQMVRLHLQS